MSYSGGGPSGPRAGFWMRFAAAFIDGLLVGIVTGILRAIISSVAVGELIGLVISIGYFVILEGGPSGAGVGKRMMGLRVIDYNTGGPIGYGRAFIRYVGRIVSAIPIFLGYFWMLWDREKQCWHDKFAGDVVVPAAHYPVQGSRSGSAAQIGSWK